MLGILFIAECVSSSHDLSRSVSASSSTTKPTLDKTLSGLVIILMENRFSSFPGVVTKISILFLMFSNKSRYDVALSHLKEFKPNKVFVLETVSYTWSTNSCVGTSMMDRIRTFFLMFPIIREFPTPVFSNSLLKVSSRPWSYLNLSQRQSHVFVTLDPLNFWIFS